MSKTRLDKDKARKQWMNEISQLASEEKIKKEHEKQKERNESDVTKMVCERCEKSKFYMRIVYIETPSYTHTFKGNRPSQPDQAMPVGVCHSCLKEGYYPMTMRTNDNSLSFYQFEEEAKKLKEDNPIEKLGKILEKRASKKEKYSGKKVGDE